MATIPPHFAKGTHSGQQEDVFVTAPVYGPAGSGQVNIFTEFQFSFKGHIAYTVYQTDLTVDLELKDHDPAAQSGPAFINVESKFISGKDEEAHYQVKDSSLVVNCALSGNRYTITIHPITVTQFFVSHEETEMSVENQGIIHLVPK